MIREQNSQYLGAQTSSSAYTTFGIAALKLPYNNQRGSGYNMTFSSKSKPCQESNQRSGVNFSFIDSIDQVQGYCQSSNLTSNQEQQIEKTKSKQNSDILILDQDKRKGCQYKGEVFKEISLNQQDGKFFHQFEGLFRSKTRQQNNKPDSFKCYRTEEVKCRFLQKVRQIPNIKKYFREDELDALFDKCQRLKLSETQWQLHVVELIRKKLSR